MQRFSFQSQKKEFVQFSSLILLSHGYRFVGFAEFSQKQCKSHWKLQKSSFARINFCISKVGAHGGDKCVLSNKHPVFSEIWLGKIISKTVLLNYYNQCEKIISDVKTVTKIVLVTNYTKTY